MSLKTKFFTWLYLLFLGLIALPLIGYFLWLKQPIYNESEFVLIGIGSVALFVFWQYLKLETMIGGISAVIEVSTWFLLVLFVLSTPAVTYISFFIGAVIYFTWFFPKSLDSKAAAAIMNTLSFGVAFLIAAYFFPFNLEKPLLLIIELMAVVAMQTLTIFIFYPVYFSLIDNKTYKEELISLSNSMLFHAIAIIVFPGLSLIAIVLWLAHYYLCAVLLLIPFLLLRRAMQGALKATQEIMDTIETLIAVIEAKDPYTKNHCNRVSLYARIIAKLCGYLDDFIDRIGRIARLHDVGKVTIADRVLKKDSHLTDEEYEHIKLHADPDKILMNQIPQSSPLKEFIELGRHHHERYDGKGYPDKLKGNAIPPEVRIISLADAWDAMTSDRVYRPKLSDEEAMREIEKYKGKQWDPDLVERFKHAHQAGVFQIMAANSTPEKLQDPPSSWSMYPLVLEYLPKLAPQSRLQHFINQIKTFFTSPLRIILTLMFSLALFLYFWNKSPFYQESIVVYAGLAILLEFWEIKFLKYPRFCPADAVYLATLFMLPLRGVYTLLSLGFLTGLFTSLNKTHLKSNGRQEFWRNIIGKKGLQLLHRLILFALSIPFFNSFGFHSYEKLYIPHIYFDNFLMSLYLFAVISLWAGVYSTIDFLFTRVETMIRCKKLKISWYVLTLERTILFEIAVVAPFAILLIGFSAMNQLFQPYLYLAFIVVLLFTRPLLNYYQQIIEDNAKTLGALTHAADSRFALYPGDRTRRYYEDHSRRTTDLAKEMAAIAGFSEEEIEVLELSWISGLGRVGIPDKILNKRDKLTDLEISVLQKHLIEDSTKIAQQYSFIKEAVPIIEGQYERWDGEGYPNKLKGEMIPWLATFRSLANAYFAMISSRPYRENPMTEQEAIEEIKANVGTQFSPDAFQAFLIALPKYKNLQYNSPQSLASILVHKQLDSFEA